jgi:hypothetical protein
MDMKDINDTNYPIIQFADKTSNFNRRRRGRKINNYLVIGYCDVLEEDGISPIKIFKICTGLPLINVILTTIPDAIQVAEWITSIFGEYFPIWDKYPEADIFSMTKWTVPEGLRKYETIRLFSAKGEIQKWMNLKR